MTAEPRGAERERFVVDADMRHGEIQVYDRVKCGVAAVFYVGDGLRPYIGAMKYTQLLENRSRAVEPAPTPEPEPEG